jgi:flagellar biosynthetic protein FliP
VHPALLASSSVSINLGNTLSKPTTSILVIVAGTFLSIAPSLLIMCTGFVRIIIVLGLTRQALGLSTTPPNQVLVGIALFVSIFLMTPTLTAMNHDGLQPYLKGQVTATTGFERAEVPLKTWMLKQTGNEELGVTEKISRYVPKDPMDAPLTTIIPAFLLTQLKSAFIIGFAIFVPFLIIDLVVSATLMSMGVVMLPPTLVSLPFKLLLFVLVDGWVLVLQTLVNSFR